MTTFQDPPPQSRRAVRQSERGETPDAQNPFLSDASTPSAPVAPASAPVAPQTGRRARSAAAPETPVGEPLIYSTQNRVSPPADEQYVAEPIAVQAPPVVELPPVHEPSAFQAPEAVQETASQSAPPIQPPPSPQGEYRVRDFSPEGGRRSAINREHNAGPAFPAPVDLDYHTEGVVPGSAHTAIPELPLEDTMNHTLSRRELRELRAAEEQAAPALKMPEPIQNILNSGPIDIPTLAPPPGQSQALAEAMAEFDLLTRTRREAEAKARDAQVASLQAQPVQAQTVQSPEHAQPEQAQPEQAPDALVEPPQSIEVAEVPKLVEPSLASAPYPTYPAPGSVPEAPVGLDPVDDLASAPGPVAQAPVVTMPIASAPAASVPAPVASAPEPVASVPAPMASVPAPMASAPAPVQSPVGETDALFIEPATRTSRSSGHWSAQVDAPDEDLPFENTLSRTVGSNTSAITTSALVLPSVPQPDGLLGSIGTTGEILITGSIDLPRSLASTGAHPGRIDNSDFEDDPLDSQVAAPDSAPVRAIRAVSTHTSTRGVIDTKLPQNNKLLTAVIITASVLCVGVIGFLIFAFATNKL